MHKPLSPLNRIFSSLLLLLLTGIAFSTAFAQSAAPRMTITGATEDLERNIRAHVSLADLRCDASGIRINRALPGIRQNLLRASRALGYYQLASELELNRTPDCWNLHISVVPGTPVTIANVAINVDDSPTLFTDLLADLPVQRGPQSCQL